MALINAVNCNKEFLGTGIGTCEVFLNNEMDGVIIVPKGWSLPVTANNVALTLANVIGLVQATTFDPIIGAIEFTDNTGDATTQEYTGGITSVVRNAKPTYQLRFESGLGFHRAAYSKNSFNQRNVILVFGGYLVGAYSPDGALFTGLSMSMFNTQTLRLPAGDTRMATLVDFQLSDEEQFNKRLAVLTPDMLGFDFSSQVQAIQNTTLTVVATAGDPIQVTVKSLNNTNYGIEALGVENFRVVNLTTNAVLAITSVEEGAIEGTYVLTMTVPLVQGANIRVELYDTDANVATALVGDNQLYKGQSATVIVAA